MVEKRTRGSGSDPGPRDKPKADPGKGQRDPGASVSTMERPRSGGGIPNNHHVLVFNRDPELRVALQKTLFVGEFHSTTTESLEEALACLTKNCYSVVLVGIDSSEAVEYLRRIREANPQVRVAAIAQAATPELVRDVMRLGADDFIFGPASSKKVGSRLKGLMKEQRPGKEVAADGSGPAGTLENGRQPPTGVRPQIICQNAKMRRVLKIAGKIAPTNSTVLILGESGTGKELMARWIHEHSQRSTYPFVDVNCGALPETLLESALFGHEKGSFTGAVHRQLGLFEVANRGTIFLDEIGEMSLAMQVKLLRVLQSREFRRIGGSQVVKVDVRVIVATNQDLKEQLDAGRFRSDLYYRINVISLDLPPLRERREEIPSLVESFCERLSREQGLPRKAFSAQAVEILQKYRWSGNVRELENAVERLILLAGGEHVEVSDIEEHLDAKADMPLEGTFAPTLTLDEVKRLHIANVLSHNEGNKMKTARMLKINVKTLYNLIRSLSIQY